eukprot:688326-Pleurochrysis_carterae.AAC.2
MHSLPTSIALYDDTRSERNNLGVALTATNMFPKALIRQKKEKVLADPSMCATTPAMMGTAMLGKK